MSGAVDRMAAQLAAWDDAADGRAVFLDCYLRMTHAVLDRIDDDGFDDPAWVARLLDRFAVYYFDSLDGGVACRPIPEPWVLAHAAAVGADAHPFQLLLAGVNAHINYDLVATTFDVLADEWSDLDPAGRAIRRHDYDTINDVIAATADLVQDEVLERRVPWFGVADRVLGRWDERAAVKLLTTWRTQVWRHTMELLDEPDPLRRGDRLVRLEHQCARRARWLLV
ncbi:MAG: DUF5995 family protein [Acidimicrobiia bacterium]